MYKVTLMKSTDISQYLYDLRYEFHLITTYETKYQEQLHNSFACTCLPRVTHCNTVF